MFSPFPVGYQPYGGYQQQQNTGYFQNGNNQPAQSKYVEVVPINTEDEGINCPMAAGSSGVFFARDDSFIVVKTVGVNGQTSVSVFDKRPPAPAAPAFDPSAYVRRDEFDGLVAAAITATATAKKGKKETEAAE